MKQKYKDMILELILEAEKIDRFNLTSNEWHEFGYECAELFDEED